MMTTPFIKYRILAIAILISLIWHVFWLTIIHVVAAPAVPAHIKFSRVSFLGPILDKGVMELKVAPRKPSFLENRHIRYLGDAPYAKAAFLEEGPEWLKSEEQYSPGDEKLVRLIEESLGDKGSEPDSFPLTL